MYKRQGINYGAYNTEIVRAGIQSVGVGQREAALAIGMTNGQIMRRVVPVSYTHLDVYKRQHLHRTVQAIRELGVRPGVTLNPATSLSTLEAVSYTHLDVYKRQV